MFLLVDIGRQHGLVTTSAPEDALSRGVGPGKNYWARGPGNR